MKTFEDLEFKPGICGFTRARMNFDNGYGVSVIYGPYAYCDENTYEVAVLKNDELCYSTPITDDVLGYQDREQVTEIMKIIQSYTKD